MGRHLKSLIPYFPIIGLSFDEILESVVEESKREKRENARKTQEEFLKKKNKRKRYGNRR